MLYINQCGNNFDIGNFSFTDGYLTDGYDVKLNIPSIEYNKYYISYEVIFLTGNANNYFFIVDTASGVTFSNYTKAQNTITLETKSDSTVKSMTIEKNKWYKVYEVFDYVAGKVDMYINGELFSNTTSVRLEQISFIRFRLNGVGIRNIVISDTEFPIDAEILSLSYDVNSEWEEAEDYYYTNSTENKITFTPKYPKGYKIAGVNFYSKVKSGDISTININDDYIDVQAVNRINYGTEGRTSKFEIKGWSE